VLKYLLDTNILIYVIKNRPAAARERFMRHHGQMAVSTVSLMELIYGAERSAAPERNLRDIEGLIARMDVLSFDAFAAAHAGRIRVDLSREGTPIGPYDQMIAGHARSLGLTLVSNNVKDFERVPGLLLENWAT
jgi:tRNA(fMet)-specific endonuclease VapC